MHINQLKIVGCGGHGKVVIDTFILCKQAMSISLCDDNKELLGKKICGLFVDSTLDSLLNFTGLIHIAIGNNKIRQNIFESINSKSLLFSIIHPSAIISNFARIELGSFIAAGSIVAADSHISQGCIINHGAVVDHEVTVGAFSHIAPNSTLGGQVVIGKQVLVGSGAIILPGITVGDGAIIAAGAVVNKNVKNNTTVMGVPAVCKE